MNPTPIKDEPLKLHEVAVATALVVAACASVAIAFTAIGTCYAADAAIKRVFRKGGRHVPR